ncbi:MAG: pyruvate kinase [Gloeomargarita sp. SKYG116]|nr:pyruvate kinase [Gloeomargarita sp. SKYG116]MCS7226237.1 pyruvate kinase [Gloeomargarita sp. SKYB31]MDW8401818.1 pyruvate kinase [Gloeomargarita sp. SKYGB_i_bin116]
MDVPFRRTKIVATVGPACNTPEILRAMVEAGVNTFRLNFSHGTHADHQRHIRLIRQLSFELNRPIGILQDLQGPKIRLGKFPDGSVVVPTGSTYILTSEPVPCTTERGYVSYDRLAEEVPVGATILLDDGRVEMRVEEVRPDTKELYCRVTVGGVLSNHKGVNFPGVSLSVKALTEKDREDLLFGLEQGVDWVALSFVRSPEDVLELKDIIAQHGHRVPVVAKIEKHEAIAQMEAVLSVCDGVMVARGDLGVEMPAQEVPLLQKRLIATANRLGIPVITATQMLDSMVHSPRPTRAEVSDVANAILDGTDAVMLSNETATGKYPVLAVQTLDKIARHMEQECLQPGMQGVYSRPFQPGGQPIANAISKAVSDVASELSAGAILTLTKTGATARNVSKFRPRTPIIAVTPHIEVARQLQLVWGVRPLLVLELPTAGQTFQVAMAMAQERGWLKEGDLVVMTAGTLPGVPGSTDLIKVGMVSAQLAQGVGVGQGLVSGRARVLRPRERLTDFQTGEILVAHQTDASLVEPMRRAAGIITEDESLTGHAAVIGLRLGVPVIVGIKNATQLIRDGAIVTLDVPRGLVYAGALRIGEMG